MASVVTPLSAIENRLTSSSPITNSQTTPVGDRDKRPKIQLCIELRRKENANVSKKKASKSPTLDLVVEVAVMFIKNLNLDKKMQAQSTYVKIRVVPGDVIYSTELKFDAKNKEKVEFIEFFDFPVKKQEELYGKVIHVIVCDRKMTRNASIYGQTEIKLDDIRPGKPICQWYNLEP